MASPHLSGVLFEPERKIVYKRNGQVVRTETKPVFEVDDNGSIKIESMKGSKHYEYAKSCDTEIENGLLQGSEIRKFLSRFKDKDVKTNTNDLMYYKETDKQGNVRKICTLGTNANDNYSDEQCTLNYNNGKLSSGVLYQTPGHKYEGAYVYDIEQNHGARYDSNGNVINEGCLTDVQKTHMNSISDKTKNQKETRLSKFINWLQSK